MNRRLPPFGRGLAAMVEAGQRPQLFGGAIVAALDWNIAEAWPRFVLPPADEPDSFRLDFCQGLDVLILFRPGHDAAHVNRARDALRAASSEIRKVNVVRKGQSPRRLRSNSLERLSV
jgi:hypothetical protein